MKKNIVIAGGGFGGLTAMLLLSKNRAILKEYRLILIDPKDHFEFIPMIPDILWGWLSPNSIQSNFTRIAQRQGFRFLKGRVAQLKLPENQIWMNGRKLDYSYLVLATGVEANFFGNQNTRENCIQFKTVRDAQQAKHEILARSRSDIPLNVLVIGGGYTGLEAATNARMLMQQHKIPGEITIIEKTSDILMQAPLWLREQVKKSLYQLKINIKTEDSLEKWFKGTAYLSSGTKFSNAVCLWSVGTQPAAYIQELEVEKIRGRIKVTHNLTIANPHYKNVFVIGDAAAYTGPQLEQPSRMAVMFALGQGQQAGKNIIKTIKGKPLQPYQGTDLGYLLPLANGRAPGMILGRKVGPRLGYLLHYSMCILRAPWDQKLKILQALVTLR